MRIAWRECVAELIGTFALCFIGAGAICTDALTRGQVGLIGIAMAHGLVLSVAVSSTMAISGGMLNPVVTLALKATGRIKDWNQVAQLIVAQFVGAAIAGFFLRSIYPMAVWDRVHLGTPALGNGTTPGMGIFIEAVLTFFLLLAVFGTAVDTRAPKLGGFGIGLTIAFDILMGGPMTGAAMNPARWFGPALASGYWTDWHVYIIGPALGGVIAGVLYDKFLRK
ncbi:MAG TPA: aquaporin [Candidatus Polarisedimenticolia bacterium]|nr:aquaporin [Candidatus Polarisedimenticolia bacterium]